MKQKAVFLDRDGTINAERRYVTSVAKFVILPGVPKAIRRLNRAGFKVVVVSNQAAIGKGLLTESMLSRIHSEMVQEVEQAGAHFDGIYYCPHRSEEGCDCRKPKVGLFLRAARELDLDLGASFVVGDKQSDIAAGAASGCTTVLIDTDVQAPATPGLASVRPDYRAKDLLSAALWVTSQEH